MGDLAPASNPRKSLHNENEGEDKRGTYLIPVTVLMQQISTSSFLLLSLNCHHINETDAALVAATAIHGAPAGGCMRKGELRLGSDGTSSFEHTTSC